MMKWTEIDMQVVEAGQEVPLDTTKLKCAKKLECTRWQKQY